MTYQEWGWMKVDGYVDKLNKHMASKYTPSDKLCIDESFSKWYGLGGFWLNKGLPHYVSMERKPVDSCEIQTLADARSRVMMQLKLVKGKQAEEKANEAPLTCIIVSVNMILSLSDGYDSNPSRSVSDLLFLA
jgi:hypothetical protein